MCGICGEVILDGRSGGGAKLVRSMMDTIRHRGPDDEGIFAGMGAVLGHRRLAIIDLNRGKQPISNEDGTVWVVFNGEIYNFKELRTQLASRGHVFRTGTDTEVIVHLYEEHGEECVDRLRGMFAFAVWDEKNRTLLLARDRVGIKPVYYCVGGGKLLFASEIKALLADPDVRREIDPEAIDRFLTFLYVPGEKTLLRNVLKLEPGHYLVARNGNVSVKRYWDLHFAPAAPDIDLKAAAAELADLFREKVRDHMISDVPVGVLLSGGVDSTALLSFVAEVSSQQVQTFTIGFDGGEVQDERPYAQIAARAFGSKHYEMTISAEQFLEWMPRYVWHMEEPVCEPPAVALYYVSKLASGYVKVLLSGEGGDEAFAGYQNYRNLLWLERAKRLGQPVRGALAAAAACAERFGVKRSGKYGHFLARAFEDYYYSRTHNPLSPFNRLRGSLYQQEWGKRNSGGNAAKYLREVLAGANQGQLLNRMLYVDVKTWLPDDLLLKADKMTMANSVELRVPYLDHEVLEFAARLPENAKVRGFTTKHILKKAFNGRVPREILNRPKTGFPVPYEAWLRRDLREPVRAVLCDRRTRERGYFEPELVSQVLAEAEASGSGAAEVFSLFTLEMWHRQFIDGRN